MLFSMTGFGDARFQDERLSASVEVRAVNNRYLKISTKCSEAYASLEGEIERIVRESISRGTVNVAIRVDRLWSAGEFALNQVALKSYWSQLQAAARFSAQQLHREGGQVDLVVMAAEIELVRARDIALRADAEELGFDGVAIEPGVDRLREHGVKRFDQPKPRPFTVDGRVLEPVGNPDVRQARGLQRLAQFSKSSSFSPLTGTLEES